MSGYYSEEGHRCDEGHLTQYQLFSGGREFYCPECDYQAFYPQTDIPMIRAQLLAFGSEGIRQFKKEMKEELEKRKND